MAKLLLLAGNFLLALVIGFSVIVVGDEKLAETTESAKVYDACTGGKASAAECYLLARRIR